MAGRVVAGEEDLARFRFAVSPLWETFAAAHTLLDPARHARHLPWVRGALLEDAGPAAIPGMSDLRLLLPRPGYVPDFLTPPPQSPAARIGDELELLRATPADRVRAELRACLLDSRRTLPDGAAERLLADPAATRDGLADLFERFWHRSVAPHWPRLRALLEADIAERARVLARNGLERLLPELDHRVGWSGGTLHVGGPAEGELRLGGRGLVLMPSAFVWPDLVLIRDEPWQPTLIYPARGIGGLWAPPQRPPDAVAAVLGRSRARVLAALSEPDTTSGLAARLSLSSAAVSAHLTALRAAGLLTAHRAGRSVRYLRSPLGTALLGS